VLGLSSDDTIHVGALVSPEMAYVPQPVIAPSPAPSPSPTPTPTPSPSSTPEATTDSNTNSETTVDTQTSNAENPIEVEPVIEGGLISVSEELCADAEKITYKVGDEIVAEGDCTQESVDIAALKLKPGEKLIAEITKSDGTKEVYSVFTEPSQKNKVKKVVAFAGLGFSTVLGIVGFSLIYKEGEFAAIALNRSKSLLLRLRMRFAK
jgi:hypothetical protein